MHELFSLLFLDGKAYDLLAWYRNCCQWDANDGTCAENYAKGMALSADPALPALPAAAAASEFVSVVGPVVKHLETRGRYLQKVVNVTGEVLQVEFVPLRMLPGQDILESLPFFRPDGSVGYRAAGELIDHQSGRLEKRAIFTTLATIFGFIATMAQIAGGTAVAVALVQSTELQRQALKNQEAAAQRRHGDEEEFIYGFREDIMSNEALRLADIAKIDDKLNKFIKEVEEERAEKMMLREKNAELKKQLGRFSDYTGELVGMLRDREQRVNPGGFPHDLIDSKGDIIAAVHANPDLAPQEDEQKMNAVLENLSRDLAAVGAPMPRFIRAPEAAANENDAVSANVTTDNSLDDVDDERE